MFRTARIRILLLVGACLGGAAAALLGVFLGAGSAAADPSCTIYWAGTNSTAWQTANNWAASDGGDPAGRVPNGTDFVCMETSPARSSVVYSTASKTVLGINFSTAGSSLEISGGVLTVNTNASTVQALTVDGGTLTGSSAVSATSLDVESGTISSTVTTGSFTGNGGTLSGQKTLTVNGAASVCTVNLASKYHLTLAGTSTMDTSVCSGVYLQNQSVLENAGTWTISGNNNYTNYPVEDDGSSASFTNDASGVVIVAMNGANRLADIDTSFSNLGAVNVTTGQFVLLEGNTSAAPADSGSYAISAGQLVQLSGGTRSLTGTVTGAGTLQVYGASVNFSAGLVVPVFDLEYGTVTGSPSVTAATLNGGTLSGSGTLTSTGTANVCTVSLDHGYRLLLDGASTMDTSVCSGVYLQNNSVLENAGTWTISGNNNYTNYPVSDDGSSASFTNDALGVVDVAMNGSSRLAYIDTSFSNLGAVNVTTGQFVLLEGNTSAAPADSGSYAISAGQLVQLTGGSRSLTGSVTGAGTLQVSGASVNFSAGLVVPVFDLEYGTVTGSPSVTAATLNGGTLSGSGTLTSTGTANVCTVSLDHGYRLLLDGASTMDTSVCSGVYLQNNSVLENAGTWTISGNNNYTSYPVEDDGSSASFTNDASGAVSVGLATSSAAVYIDTPFTNNGTLSVTKGQVSPVDGVTNLTGAGKLTGGSWIANGGQLTLPNAVTNNAATIMLAATGSFSPNLTTLSTNSGSLGIGQNLNETVALTNSGTVGITGGTFRPNSYTETAGFTNVQAGATLKAGSSGTGAVVINGGTLFGTGTVQGTVSGTGTVSPGASHTGTLSISGTYSVPAAGALVVDAGTAGATSLTVSGAASLNGSLLIGTPGGVPTVGSSYTVLGAASITGTFATIINQDLPSASAYWAVSYTGTAVTITLTPYPVATVGAASINEGNSGTSTLAFPVTLDSASPFTTTVSYASSDGSATAGSDYTAVSGTLTFAPGETSKSVNVLVNGDTLYEHDETLTLTISNPDHATISGVGTATGTILNDDPAPVVSIANAGATVDATSGATVTFPVTLSAVSGLDASVNYATSDGTAVAGTDYTATSGTLTILAGSTTANLTVPVSSQPSYAAPKTFTMTLSGPVNATLGTATATGTITNDNPNITSVSPGTLYQAKAVVVTVNGKNFGPGSTVKISGSKMPVSDVVVVTTQKITAKVSPASDAATGPRSLTVTTPGTGSATCVDCLTVLTTPTVTSVSPSTLPRGAASATGVTITGTDFQSGAVVTMKPMSGIKITSGSTIVVNPTTVTFSVKAQQSAALGLYKVKVKNPDGGAASCKCLTVTGPAVTSASPNTINRGVPTALTIHGSGFDPAATLDVGCGLSGTTTTATAISTTVTCTGHAPLGVHGVIVTNPDGSQFDCKHCLSVAGPNITGISPASVQRGHSAALTITGTGFVSGATVSASACTFSATTVVDAHTITVTITCPSNAPKGTLPITVTNPASAGSAISTYNGFAVTQ